MILINLKKNKNEKMPNAFGKYYAFPVINQTIGMDLLHLHKQATIKITQHVP